jgi:hypothetical protein
VTGHVEDRYLKKALDSGMNQVTCKPLNIEIIKDLLEQLFYFEEYQDYNNVADEDPIEFPKEW